MVPPLTAPVWIASMKTRRRLLLELAQYPFREETWMRKTLLLIAMMTATVALGTVTKESTVKRLDGSTITLAEIDGTVTRLMRAAEVTGAGIAILNDGKIAYLKSYGVRDKEKNLPLTEDSVMTAASFTKIAFACLAMQLVDQKVLDLDQPVYEYLPKPLPEYPEYKDL